MKRVVLVLAGGLVAGSCSFTPAFMVFNDTGQAIRLADGPTVQPGSSTRARFLIRQVNAVEARGCTWYYRAPDLAASGLRDLVANSPGGMTDFGVRIAADMSAHAYRYDPASGATVGEPLEAGGFPLRPSRLCPEGAVDPL